MDTVNTDKQWHLKNNNTYTWNVVIIADTLTKQPISNLPCKNWWTFSFEISNLVDHRLCSYSRLGSTNRSRLYTTSFIVPTDKKTFISQTMEPFLVTIIPSKDFRNATIWNLQNSGYIARPGAGVSQFHNFLSGGVRQWSSVHINTSQLVYTTVSCRWTSEYGVLAHRMMHEIFLCKQEIILKFSFVYDFLSYSSQYVLFDSIKCLFRFFRFEKLRWWK